MWGDRPYPSEFDTYFNQPKIYPQPRYYESTWEKISVRFRNDAKSEFWDFNMVDDEGLSVTFNKVDLAGVNTVTLKDVNGTITAEIE